jgi:hypothetical protein
LAKLRRAPIISKKTLLNLNSRKPWRKERKEKDDLESQFMDLNNSSKQEGRRQKSR